MNRILLTSPEAVKTKSYHGNAHSAYIISNKQEKLNSYISDAFTFFLFQVYPELLENKLELLQPSF